MTAARRRQLVFGAGVALLAAMTLVVGHESRRAVPPSPVPTVDNPGPQGLEAAFLYLASHGGARALEEPLTALTPDAKLLVVALPLAREVTADEREALLRWVDAGGTLVVLGDHQRGFGGLLTGVADPVFVALHLKDREIGLAEIGRDVKSLLESADDPSRNQVVPARLPAPDPLLAGAETLAVGAGRGFDAEPGPLVPLAIAGDTPVALGLARGRGRIVLFAGPDALTNAKLDLADNPQLLANLSALGPALFDEHHHREATSEAAGALLAQLGIPALAAVAAALLLVLAVGRRLGPLQPERPPARTAREYAVQLGRLYGRAHAERALAQDLAAQLRDRARERVHLPPSAADSEVVARLAQDGAARARRYGELCARLDAAAAGPLGPEGYAALAREAARVRGEL